MEMIVDCNGNIFEQKTSPYMVLVNLHYATRITAMKLNVPQSTHPAYTYPTYHPKLT